MLQLTPDLLNRAQNSLIVTSSARESNELAYAYQKLQTDAGKTAWRPLNVMSYGSWLLNLYTDLQERSYKPAQRLLIDDQALRLVVRQNAPHEDVSKHIEVIMEAWRLTWNWNLWSVWHDVTQTENGKLCKQWFDALRNHLDTSKLISRPELESVIIRAIEDGHCAIPSISFFHILDEYRVQKQVFDSLERHGTQVNFIQPSQQSQPHGSLVQFDSDDLELNAIGTWARIKIAQYGKHARLGIVNRGWTASAIRSQFESSFPELYDIGQLVHPSVGRTLSNTPLWREFMTLIRWVNSPLHFSELDVLRRSVVFESLQIPPALDGRTYKEYIPLDVYARRSEAETAAAIVKEVRDWKRQNRSPRSSITQHIDLVKSVIQVAGWHKTPDKPSTVLVQSAIEKALDELLKNSGILGDVSWSTFVDLFNQVGSATPLNESSDQAPIHVLSRIQVRGFEFDAMWISGVSDADWPPSSAPNAMIPLAMQKKAQIPRTDPDGELNFAKETTKYWLASSNDITFSFTNEDQETKAEPSPLIGLQLSQLTDVLDDQANLASLNHPWEMTQYDGELETYKNAQASPLEIPRRSPARTSLLSNQANCPFKAWAENRLQLLGDDPDEPETFPGPRERGTLFHNLMELISEEHKTLADFLRLGADSGRLDDYIERAFKKTSRRASNPPQLYVQHEKRILRRMVRVFLAQLEDSADFTIVETELKQPINIGPFIFTPRVDVLMKDESGRTTVIDYKTGTVRPPTWNPALLNRSEKTRKVDTQIALYSQLLFQHSKLNSQVVQDIGFQEVRTSGTPSQNPVDGVVVKKHLARNQGFIESAFEGSFEAFQECWQKELLALTEDFVAGYAEITPRTDVCQYCDLQRLCRVYEKADED